MSAGPAVDLVERAAASIVIVTFDQDVLATDLDLSLFTVAGVSPTGRFQQDTNVIQLSRTGWGVVVGAAWIAVAGFSPDGPARSGLVA